MLHTNRIFQTKPQCGCPLNQVSPWGPGLRATCQRQTPQFAERLLPSSKYWPVKKCASKVLLPAGAGATSAITDENAHNPLGLTYQSILEKDEKVKGLPPPPKASTFTHVLPYLIRLASEERALLWRVGLAFMCLLFSKSAGLMCPIMIRDAVNSFAQHAAAPAGVAAAAATKALLLYGACDALKHCSKELQGPLFTPVSQAASRRVAFHTFAHIMGLDVQYHLERRTGRVARILERGTRSIQMLYRAVIFTFIPTALELLVVCTVLARAFSPLVIAADARKEVNILDNATGAKCVDALLNFETVALFGNQKLEVLQYNEYLKGYRASAVKTERLASLLNAGQALILSCGLTSILVTAVNTSVGGAVTAGDLMMIQGLLLQLWAPLQFLGWFYRELRSALVDMEEFFAILRTESHIKDGTLDVPDSPLGPSSTEQDTRRSSSASGGSSVSSSASEASKDANFASQHHSGFAGRNGSSHVSDAGSNGSQAGSSSYTNGSSYTYSSGSSTRASLGDSINGGHQGSEDAFKARMQSGSQASGSERGLRVEMRDVHFGYAGSRKILRGVSVDLQPGTSMAFVGSSGSGKSTMLKLLTRLYDVSSGAVLLNGVDVRDLKLESLRKAVAVVPQEAVLLNDTIMSNIRYGRPEATDEEVIEAAKLASLHEAVVAMPGQYNSVVGERGLKLSGGEKQRVAIARAFLRQPRLLICDEATSSLDTGTEAQIMGSLSQLAQGRTAVFVAHRLSTVRHCDQIVVLRGGEVVERGSHNELMAVGPGGVYHDAWQLQAREDLSGDSRDRADMMASTSDLDDDAWLSPIASASTSSIDGNLSAIGSGAKAGL
ncbi:hypothetical protein DUNSADRAFT_17366 [Dunaliella salina]|uniref:Uncharacterized protein n=1 Tax=Dunaliella salina TaxID=3046 RepID=A0ABQ7H073_DUNSA|nr:hypothetical protein DUNSADRAFT_17366 [Dunaliella salina]|eukprot:KAF5840263.1 hypothetical protein DUNSADRAFT_17366 [Dunaliella salina]